jgi:hypothetical protein
MAGRSGEDKENRKRPQERTNYPDQGKPMFRGGSLH